MLMVREVKAAEGFLLNVVYLTWICPNADPAMKIPLVFASWHWGEGLGWWGGTRKHDGRNRSMGERETSSKCGC